MDELIRALLAMSGHTFPEHGYEVGDRVRMTDSAKHTFEHTETIMQNGDEGTVVDVFLYNGMMPVFEVRPDSGKTQMIGDELLESVPFGCEEDFASVVKIEE